MAITTTALRETLAIAYGQAAPYASLHSADPGTTGTSEISGGAPAYARKLLTWNAGTSDGVVTATATFDVPANVGVTYAGLWSAGTAGTFLDKVGATYASQSTQGQMTVTFTFTQV